MDVINHGTSKFPVKLDLQKLEVNLVPQHTANSTSKIPRNCHWEHFNKTMDKEEISDEIIIYLNPMVLAKNINYPRAYRSSNSNKTRSVIIHNLPITVLEVLLFFLFIGLVSGNCQYVAVNLAKYDQCIDNVCKYTTSVDTNIQLLNNEQICLDFEGVESTNRLNVTVNFAIQLKTLEYTYFSGDPLFDSKGLCSCNNGLTTGSTCSNSCSSLNLAYSNLTSCRTGSHQSSNCIASGLNMDSTWCKKYGLSTNNRIKINKYSDLSQIMIQLSLAWGNKSEEILLTGFNKEVKLKTLPFIVTGYDLSIVDSVAPTFIVIDRLHARDFYMIPPNEINTLNQYDMAKIGWIKYKHLPITAPSNLAQVSSVLLNCERNSFRDFKPWFTTEQLLNSYKKFLSDEYNPHTILIDSDFPTSHYTRDDHPTIANYLLEQGFIFTDLNGALKSWGITLDGSPSIYPETNYYMTLLTNHGNKTEMFSCDESPMTDQFGDLFFVGFCIDRDLNYGFYSYYWNCIDMNCTVGLEANFGTTFQVHLWPDRLTTIIWNGTIIDINQDLGKEILIPYKQATLNVKLDFKGMNVTFIKTTVLPEIRSLTVEGYFLLISALSLSNEGNCYLSTTPSGLLIPISIYLRSQQIEFNITLSQIAFNGTALIHLTCGPTVISRNLTISYNNTPSYLKWASEVSENNTWSQKKVDLLGVFTNFKLLSWKARFLSIVLWILILIGFIILILIIIGTRSYLIFYYILIKPIFYITKKAKRGIPVKGINNKVNPEFQVTKKEINKVNNLITEFFGIQVLNEYNVLMQLREAGKLRSSINRVNSKIPISVFLVVPSCYRSDTTLVEGEVYYYKCPCVKLKLINPKLTLIDVIAQGKVQVLLEELEEEFKILPTKTKLNAFLIMPIGCACLGSKDLSITVLILAYIKLKYQVGFEELPKGTDLLIN